MEELITMILYGVVVAVFGAVVGLLIRVIGYMWLRLTSKGKDSMKLKTDPLEAGLFLISRTLTALALLYGMGSIVAPTPNPYGPVGFGLALFLLMLTPYGDDNSPYTEY